MAPMSTYSVRDAYGQMANKMMDQIDAHDLVSLWCANEDDTLAPTTSWSDTADLDRFLAARGALRPNLSLRKPAPRYRA